MVRLQRLKLFPDALHIISSLLYRLLNIPTHRTHEATIHPAPVVASCAAVPTELLLLAAATSTTVLGRLHRQAIVATPRWGPKQLQLTAAAADDAASHAAAAAAAVMPTAFSSCVRHWRPLAPAQHPVLLERCALPVFFPSLVQALTTCSPSTALCSCSSAS